MLNNQFRNRNLPNTAVKVKPRTLSAAFKWWPAVLLGLATIGAYGLVLYAFSVFIEPIKAETGWSDGALSGAFSLGMLVSGMGALLAGRLLDQVGSRPVMLGSLIIGSALLLTAASAKSLPVFVLCWGVGGGIIGAGFFYNVTMAVTTRLFDSNRTKAFVVITGLTYGTILPLHGLYAAEVFGKERIGTLMGVQTTIIGLFAALEPIVLGLTIDLTGGYGLLLIASALITGLAMWLLIAGKESAS